MKLYRLIRNLELPRLELTTATKTGYRVRGKVQTAAFALVWPNGTPCLLAEMYLMDVSPRYTKRPLDGGSLKSIAIALSHLLRLAYQQRIPLWEISDGQLRPWVAFLQDEVRETQPDKKKRNHNTVDTIVAHWVAFLRWAQETVFRDRRIVGPAASTPQIPLHERIYVDKMGQRRTVWKYRYEPTVSTPEPKGPIGRDNRLALWDAIQLMSDRDRIDPRYRATFQNRSDMEATLDYLRRRRELVLEIFRGTGCRPGEQARLRESLNRNCASVGKLEIETLKTRRESNPSRRVPLDQGLAIRIELFAVKHRLALIDRLQRTNPSYVPSDYLFLSVTGEAISESTLETEFRRIMRVAGFVNERLCMSMFRHRFITTQVALHLRSFMTESPGKTRGFMTDADYRTILRRVATITGHKDENSLFHYIDLAWEELGVFNHVDAAAKLVDGLEGAVERLASLMTDIKQSRHSSRRVLADIVLPELTAMRDGVVDLLRRQGDRSASRLH